MAPWHQKRPMKLTSPSLSKFDDAALYARMDAGVEAACFFNPQGVLYPPGIELQEASSANDLLLWVRPLIEIARRYDVTFVLHTDMLEQYLAAAPEVLGETTQTGVEA